MNNKPVDKTKKSNIKCEHCQHWDRITGICSSQNATKNYWNRCKQFEWRD